MGGDEAYGMKARTSETNDAAKSLARNMTESLSTVRTEGVEVNRGGAPWRFAPLGLI